jgi:hypothetical protein
VFEWPDGSTYDG